MSRHTVSIVSILLILLLVGTLLVSCGGGSTTTSSSSGTDGKSLLETRCSVCHSLSRVTSLQLSAADWTTVVQIMVERGAQLNATEQQTLIDYLAATYK
jgi:hypothetical protein